MKLNLRSVLAILFIGFIAGLAIFSLFGSSSNTTAKPVSSTKEIRKEADQIHKNEQERVLEFESKAKKLEKVIADLKNQLSIAKSNTGSTESKIRRIIPETKLRVGHDTSSTIHCDSLAETVQVYIRQNHAKDSLYDEQIDNLEDIVQAKDSVISIKENSNNSLQSVIDRSIAQQTLLLDENALLQKNVRKERTKRKLLSAAMVILSGITTSMILKK